MIFFHLPHSLFLKIWYYCKFCTSSIKLICEEIRNAYIEYYFTVIPLDSVVEGVLLWKQVLIKDIQNINIKGENVL